MITEMPHFLEASEHNNVKEYIKLLSRHDETSSLIPGVVELGALLEWLGCRAEAQLFSRATCLELDRTSAALSFSVKAASHFQP